MINLFVIATFVEPLAVLKHFVKQHKKAALLRDFKDQVNIHLFNLGYVGIYRVYKYEVGTSSNVL